MNFKNNKGLTLDNKIKKYFLDNNHKEYNILSEHELLDSLLQNKILKESEIEFYNDDFYRYIEVKEMEFVPTNSLLLKDVIYSNKKRVSLNSTLEPVIIKSPDILYIYYKSKNIKFSVVNQVVLDDNLIDLYLYQKYKINDVLLNHCSNLEKI